jgi:hypothetical protein
VIFRWDDGHVRGDWIPGDGQVRAFMAWCAVV